MNMNRSFNKFANLLIFGLAVGISVSGCGGGGGAGGTGGAGGGNAASSYIADQQGGGFVAYWWYHNSASSVAQADVRTLIPSGTTQYNSTVTPRILSRISVSWETDPSRVIYYDLVPSGWLAGSRTGSLVPSGGNNITLTPTGEPGFSATVTRTDLANTPIVCISPITGSPATCPAPSNYPAGSASYQLTSTFTSNQFILYDNDIALAITDSSGNTLNALPTLNTTTFCIPGFSWVFQPQGSPYTYNVLYTASCAQADISAAIATPLLQGTVVINNQATGNATVANVLHVVSATGFSGVTSLVDMTFGERAGSVWYGWMRLAGTYPNDPEMNKAATNAQLRAYGLLALP